MKRILIIGHRWPESKSSAAGTRMMQLIDHFYAASLEVHFASSASANSFSDNLSNKVASTKKILGNDGSFDAFLKKLRPGIVIFDRFMTEEMFGWRVNNSCPDALRVLDTEDLHFLRKARQKNLHKDSSLSLLDLQNDLSKREIASILRCDLSLIISEFELDLLLREFKIPESILCYWPIFPPKIFTADKQETPDFGQRKNFMFIGNFHHKPNLDCVRFIKEKIWPEISRRLPAAKLNIYGAYPTEFLKQLHRPDQNFYIKGRIEDAAKAFQSHRVLLAPLRFGAGLKGKFLEAMCYGVPSITTSIGAEGINGNLDWPGFIADHEKQIIKKAIELNDEEALWKTAQKQGWHILEKRFDPTNFTKNLDDRVLELSENLSEHRQKNFIGQLLNHHQHQSTKFMSRWIEEKNKK
jgi:glycosyltransferase involved in cell wall biosynthesis